MNILYFDPGDGDKGHFDRTELQKRISSVEFNFAETGGVEMTFKSDDCELVLEFDHDCLYGMLKRDLPETVLMTVMSKVEKAEVFTVDYIGGVYFNLRAVGFEDTENSTATLNFLGNKNEHLQKINATDIPTAQPEDDFVIGVQGTAEEMFWLYELILNKIANFKEEIPVP